MMYYELYVDSLFLVNFVMNLYLLLLVNQSMFRTATRKRLILGAAIGAGFYFLPFFLEGPVWLKYLLGILPGNISMIVVTFRVRSFKTFFRVLESILKYSVLMGGVMLLIRKLPWVGDRMMGTRGILGVGALLYLLTGYLMERREQSGGLCRVTLMNEENKITVIGLLDSGNSLVEPISGKPVSVIEKDILLSLFQKEPRLYRPIPYHSIGKKRGILKGYLLPQIQIEIDGVTKICKEVYIAVCDEYIASEGNNREGHVKMILNPDLLYEVKEKKNRKVWLRYDIESGSSR